MSAILTPALMPGIFTPAPTRALYSPRETEVLLGISHATLYRLLAAGKLDARKIGSKTVITAESIERFLEGLPRAECAV
jgi:excisionase family DNA binding protein